MITFSSENFPSYTLLFDNVLINPTHIYNPQCLKKITSPICLRKQSAGFFFYTYIVYLKLSYYLIAKCQDVIRVLFDIGLGLAEILSDGTRSLYITYPESSHPVFPLCNTWGQPLFHTTSVCIRKCTHYIENRLHCSKDIKSFIY